MAPKGAVNNIESTAITSVISPFFMFSCKKGAVALARSRASDPKAACKKSFYKCNRNNSIHDFL